MADIKTLKNNFECAVHAYMMEFCKKHGFFYDKSEWVGDNIGGVIEVADYFFNFDDIRLDIDTEQKVGNIEAWHDYCVEVGCIGGDTISVNYNSWCMGYRPYTDEQIKRMQELRRDIEKQKEMLKDMCKDFRGNQQNY